jgi:hypothetical protein
MPLLLHIADIRAQNRNRDAKLVGDPMLDRQSGVSQVQLQTKAQWQHAIIERRIEIVKKGSPFLDDIVEHLVALRGLEDWMISALLDSAVDEWDNRVRDFIDQCKCPDCRRGGAG